MRKPPLLTLGPGVGLIVRNHGDFTQGQRLRVNELLAALGRPERFVDAGERGWAVRGGPHQGPGRLAIAPNGKLEIFHHWPPKTQPFPPAPVKGP